MAVFTFNILSDKFTSAAKVTNCLDVQGTDNNNIYYTNPVVANGSTIYSNADLNIFFDGGGFLYRLNNQPQLGNVNFENTQTSDYIFNIDTNGVVSNLITC